MLNYKKMLWLCGLLLPLLSPAYAHTTGLGYSDFVSALLHPYFVPSQLLLLLASGLLIGQQTSVKLRQALPIFMIAALLGFAVGLFWQVSHLTLIILLLALVSGLLVALAYALPGWLLIAIISMTGFILGLDSLADTTETTHTLTYGSGLLLSLSLTMLYTVAIAERLTRPWMKIAARIIGSWIFTISVMIMSFIFYGAVFTQSHGIVSDATSKEQNQTKHRYRSRSQINNEKTNDKVTP